MVEEYNGSSQFHYYSIAHRFRPFLQINVMRASFTYHKLLFEPQIVCSTMELIVENVYT